MSFAVLNFKTTVWERMTVKVSEIRAVKCILGSFLNKITGEKKIQGRQKAKMILAFCKIGEIIFLKIFFAQI